MVGDESVIYNGVSRIARPGNLRYAVFVHVNYDTLTVIGMLIVNHPGTAFNFTHFDPFVVGMGNRIVNANRTMNVGFYVQFILDNKIALADMSHVHISPRTSQRVCTNTSAICRRSRLHCFANLNPFKLAGIPDHA